MTRVLRTPLAVSWQGADVLDRWEPLVDFVNDTHTYTGRNYAIAPARLSQWRMGRSLLQQSEGILFRGRAAPSPGSSPLRPVVFVVAAAATRPRCCDSHSSFRRSHHRDLGIIIHSAGNVTVLHAEKRCLLEQKHHSWRGREWRTGVAHGEHWMQEIVTYGGSRVSLNRDVNCEPHDVL